MSSLSRDPPFVTAGRVLMAVIVEDDAFIRELAEIMIKGWGHRTLLASDVDEALSLLRSPKHIDALFTDIYLKTAILGGYALAHQAVYPRPACSVIVKSRNRVRTAAVSDMARREKIMPDRKKATRTRKDAG